MLLHLETLAGVAKTRQLAAYLKRVSVTGRPCSFSPSHSSSAPCCAAATWGGLPQVLCPSPPRGESPADAGEQCPQPLRRHTVPGRQPIARLVVRGRELGHFSL